jgi:hypothetical protein
VPATTTTQPFEQLEHLDAALAEICRLAEELPHQTDQIRQLFLDANGDVLDASGSFPFLTLSKALSEFPTEIETVATVIWRLVEQIHAATLIYREIATTPAS